MLYFKSDLKHVVKKSNDLQINYSLVILYQSSHAESRQQEDQVDISSYLDKHQRDKSSNPVKIQLLFGDTKYKYESINYTSYTASPLELRLGDKNFENCCFIRNPSTINSVGSYVMHILIESQVCKFESRERANNISHISNMNIPNLTITIS